MASGVRARVCAPRVLVLEPYDDLRDTIAELFSAHAWETILFASRDAVAELGDERVDVALVSGSFLFPRAAALETVARVRRVPALRHVPIVALASPVHEARFAELGIAAAADGTAPARLVETVIRCCAPATGPRRAIRR